MVWFKVDDQLAFHPKAIAAGNAALGLWVRAGSWCGNNLTDGALSRNMIRTLGGQKRDADKLVAVGLWCETPTGYQFCDWDHWQPTKAQVTAERATTKARVARWREDRGNAVTPTVTNGVRTPAPSPTRPVPVLPTEVPTTKTPAVSTRGTRLPDDWQPSPALIAWARTECPNVDARVATEKFRDYWHAKAGKDAIKVKWDATWRGWMRRDAERAPSFFPAPVTNLRPSTTDQRVNEARERGKALHARLQREAQERLEGGTA